MRMMTNMKVTTNGFIKRSKGVKLIKKTICYFVGHSADLPPGCIFENATVIFDCLRCGKHCRVKDFTGTLRGVRE